MTTRDIADDRGFEHNYVGGVFVALSDSQQLAVMEYMQEHNVTIEVALWKITDDDSLRPR